MGVPNKWWFFVEPKKIQKEHKTKKTPTITHVRGAFVCAHGVGLAHAHTPCESFVRPVFEVALALLSFARKTGSPGNSTGNQLVFQTPGCEWL